MQHQTQSLDPYTYSAIDLDRPSIRLIRLLNGSDNAPIKCELFNAWLYDEVMDYEALSYTWGGHEKPFAIEVGGAQLHVTENLFLALKRLRYAHQDRILWIDAISIDQENVGERGHQVNQMGRIYSQADQVVIWLGEESLEINTLMDSLKQLHREHINSGGQGWMPADARWLQLWLRIQPALRRRPDLISHYVSPEDLQRRGLRALLDRPWFKRIWILQEVANARRAMVMAGSRVVTARIFAIAPTLMGTAVRHHVQAVLDIMPGPSRNHSWWSQRRDLHTLLTKFRGSEASDPKDMIFALLGISSDQENHRLRPDYTEPVGAVIEQVRQRLLGGQAVDYGVTVDMAKFLESLSSHNDDSLHRSIQAWTLDDAVHTLKDWGTELHVTTRTVEAVALIQSNREQIMTLLLAHAQQMATDLNQPCEDIVMKALLEQEQATAPVSKSGLVIFAGFLSLNALSLVLDRRGWDGVISVETVIAVAHQGLAAKDEIMQLLLQHPSVWSGNVEDLLVEFGEWAFTLKTYRALIDLGRRGGAGIEITEPLVRSLGISASGNAVMNDLLRDPHAHFNLSPPVINEILKRFTVEIVTLVDDKRSIDITESIVRAALDNANSGDQIMRLLLGRRADSSQWLTDALFCEIVPKLSVQTVHALLARVNRKFRVPDVVVQAAGLSREQMKLLLLHHQQWGYVPRQFSDWSAFQSAHGYTFVSLQTAKERALHSSDGIPAWITDGFASLEKIYQSYDSRM